MCVDQRIGVDDMELSVLKKCLNISEDYDYDYLMEYKGLSNETIRHEEYAGLRSIYYKLTRIVKKSSTINDYRNESSIRGFLGFSKKPKPEKEKNSVVRNDRAQEEKGQSDIELIEKKSDGDIYDLLIEIEDYPEVSKSILFQIEYIKTILELHPELYINRDYKRILDEQIKQKLEENYDERLYSTIIFLCDSDADDKDFVLDRFLKLFNLCIKNTISQKKYDSDSLFIFQLYCQITASILCELRKKWIARNLERESFAFFAFLVGEVMKNDENPYNKLFYARRGIRVNVPRYRYEAFDNLASFALAAQDLQLANDACLTWIDKEAYGTLLNSSIKFLKWGTEEDEWRHSPNGKQSLASMKAYLAMVEGLIGDTYDASSKHRKVFYELAVKNARAARKIEPNDGFSCLIYALALSDGVEIKLNTPNQINRVIREKKLALEQFECYREMPMTKYQDLLRLKANRHCINTIMELIFFETYQLGGDNEETDTIKNYYDMLRQLSDEYFNDLSLTYKNKAAYKELKERDKLSSILTFNNEYTMDDKWFSIHILLIAIRICVSYIKENLHRQEYITTDYDPRIGEIDETRSDPKDVAYYTTLNNITHVFEELYIDKNGKIALDTEGTRNDTKNCLTVMNAKYMNDPNEGRVIIEDLLKHLGKERIIFQKDNSKDIIDSIFNNNFVFLKSFTEAVDKLTMWNRYANDYSKEGNNSNGCCVLVDPLCFVNDVSKNEVNANPDDYSLYRIVYLSTNGKIETERNIGLNKNVEKLYEKLKFWVSILDEYVGGFERKHSEQNEEMVASLKSDVEDILKESLLDIVFLFKNDDYADEQESRLILFRNADTQNDIRCFGGDIPLLALNPFFQIYINKVILGPNVRNVDKWKPYFQYQLNRMWNKRANDKRIIDNPENLETKYIIRKSSIDYYT